MYLVPIHVPIYADGGTRAVASDWHRSLLLLRDALQGRYGPLTVLAPGLPAAGGAREQVLQAFAPGDEVRLVAVPGLDCRAREFWLRRRAAWRAAVARHVAEAQVVHGALDDLYKPIAFEGVREALRQGKPTIFVQDTDHVLRIREACRGAPLPRRLREEAFAFAYERACRWAVARADLSLLKGRSLMERYGPFARNARDFHDTSYALADVVARDRLERRLATLAPGRPVRLVYCGRLVERKGLSLSLRLLARAIAAGADLTLDLVGDGPQRAALEAATASAPLAARVRFLGSMPYGRALLDALAEYDALLFTPTREDTPRMIFDGYAAGLPLLGSEIAYVRERHDAEGATVLLDRADEDRAAAALVRVARDPASLAPLARRARDAAEYHAADAWYRRRAEWTFEAVARHAAGPGDRAAP